MQRYRSSAPEPVSAFSWLAASKIAAYAGALCPGGFCIGLECFGKAGVHIKGRRIVHLRRDKAQVDSGGSLIGLLIQFAERSADDLAVIIDRRHPPHIAAVGDLIALSVEPVAGAAVGNRLLGAAQIIHPFERAGNALTRCVEADRAVHIDVQLRFCLADGSEQLAFLVQQIQEEAGNVCNSLIILRFRHGKNGFILRFRHDLMAQIGIFNPRDIGIAVENALRVVQEGLELVLVADSVLQRRCQYPALLRIVHIPDTPPCFWRIGIRIS